MNTATTLIEALEHRRQAAGLSVGAFTQRLGISRAMWLALRNGSRAPGPRTLQRILTAYPSLTDLCVIALRDRPVAVPDQVTNGALPTTHRHSNGESQ